MNRNLIAKKWFDQDKIRMMYYTNSGINSVKLLGEKSNLEIRYFLCFCKLWWILLYTGIRCTCIWPAIIFFFQYMRGPIKHEKIVHIVNKFPITPSCSPKSAKGVGDTSNQMKLSKLTLVSPDCFCVCVIFRASFIRQSGKRSSKVNINHNNKR
jgi:hypothetical protein